jgi:hypothetical protein
MKEITNIIQISEIWEPRRGGAAVASVDLFIDDWLTIKKVKIIKFDDGGHEIHFPPQQRAGEDGKYQPVLERGLVVILEEKIILDYLKMIRGRNEFPEK